MLPKPILHISATVKDATRAADKANREPMIINWSHFIYMLEVFHTHLHQRSPAMVNQAPPSASVFPSMFNSSR